MTVWSPLFERWMELSRHSVHRVGVEADIPLKMSDGVFLKSDRFYPLDGRTSWPTLMIRTPYGRRGLFRYLFAYPFARRGFQVILQSTRGTHDAEGRFDPFHHERSDGLETVDWIEGQPWFNGQLIAYGVSYTGYANWSIASELGDRLQAVVCGFATCSVRDFAYPGGCFLLHDALHWAATNADGKFSATRGAWNIIRKIDKKLQKAMYTIPLTLTDQKAIKQEVSFFQDWLHHHPPEDDWWETLEFFPTLEHVDVPVLMVAGWQDVFLPLQIRDYLRLKETQTPVSLHVGPWVHTDLQTYYYTAQAGIPWMKKVIEDAGGFVADPAEAHRVRVYLTGSNEWSEAPVFPAEDDLLTMYLQPEGGLRRALPKESEPSDFVYDPREPTPMIGGPSLAQDAGYRDQKVFESRSDVLVFTGETLSEDCRLLGHAEATIFTRVSGDYFDVFVRLCDVDTKGRSVNVSDGVVRICPKTQQPDEEGVYRITLTLSPMGHVFQKGHRLRVQIAGGAHPRFVRNFGTDEPLPHATSFVPTHRKIFHDPERPSHIILPRWSQIS